MNKKLLMTAVLSLSLTGCVGAFVAGAATGGIAVYEKRDLKTLKNDQNIREGIHKQIVRDPQFGNSHIVVSSYSHDVLLAGQTPSDSLRVTAEKVARDFPGVARVYNEVTIGYPTSISQRSKDTWITTKVKSALLTTSDLRSGDVKVITENSVVYLMGNLSRTQAELAVNAARRVKSVRKVVKVFRYQS